MFYIYVIKSKNNKFYIGQTKNLENRILRHNKILKSNPKSYTSKIGDNWELIYSETYATRKEAMQRERQLKSYQGRKFIKNYIQKTRR